MIHIYIMYLPISEKNDGNRTGQKHRTEHKAGTELLAVGLRELYGMELNRAGLSYGSMESHICGITRKFILISVIAKDWQSVYSVIQKREWMLKGSEK